jgi:hypothetical protein
VRGTSAIADRAREFAGWVELTGALEDARLTTTERVEDRRPPSGWRIAAHDPRSSTGAADAPANTPHRAILRTVAKAYSVGVRRITAPQARRSPEPRPMSRSHL